MRKKRALVLGVTGQDGSYLAELLLQKGYAVYGMVRRASSFNTARIDHLIGRHPDFEFYRGDINDINSLISVIREVRPDEIYNLAAQSHVKVSFEIPVYTFDTVATGTLKLLEAVRSLGISAKIYQAGSSEMFGGAAPPQNENTPFAPRSPYAAAKVAAYHLCVNYREAYGMWIANGILFNHESPRRGETFVTRKVTMGVAGIKLGVQKKLVLGNLYARRDWGYAPEYVEAMWLMLQQDKPDDYVIATGKSHSVKEFVTKAFEYAGYKIAWYGSGLDEKGIDERSGEILVEVDKRLFRPTEADFLMGDYTKARERLGWKPRVGFDELVRLMVEADIKRKRLLLEGTKVYNEEWRDYIV
ncbi:MAG: GDP-mannose 4,6-dehydratase [Candidatus Methanomethyliaceae archaeon]